nr:immunoglobulin light chain junction region [Macaca mulatta]MOV61437.1 immunoglobulin light chain junction region [Macaca mulatta]MOV62636.1 immunoglobulin light chain junction region [Macaca mulatta]MOV63643.1 immunoglobulin light chain junction region [Macaca mulatta]MOV64442.1 immunoglobulin light chain junction region [Macaca mulatta]
CLQYNSDPYNF